MSGRIKIKSKDKDKRPKIDVFKGNREPVQEYERASGSYRHGSKERASQDPGRDRL